MIGRRIASEPGRSAAPIVFLALGAVLVVIAFTAHDISWALGAALPLSMGVALLLVPDRPFVATFREHAILVGSPPEEVPYASIEGLFGVNRPRSPHLPGPSRYAIHVLHPAGSIHIPASIDASCDEVYRFLAEQVPTRGSRQVHPLLADYLAQQEATFGADRVWSYRAATHLNSRPRHRRLQAATLGALVGAGIWLVGSAILGESRLGESHAGWIGAALTVIVTGLIVLLATVVDRNRRSPHRIKDWKQSSLIISPVGLALVQGDIQGEVRWDELRDVKLIDKVRGFRLSNSILGPGIELKVAGASILIADIYDRPLHVLHERIADYWR